MEIYNRFICSYSLYFKYEGIAFSIHTNRNYNTILCYNRYYVTDIYKILISRWCVISRPVWSPYGKTGFRHRKTNYRGKLTIIITAVHFIGHISRTVEPFVASLMQRNAMTIIARPFVRAAYTVISLHRPIVTAQLVAIIVRTINSAIAMLMSWYAITALALPFFIRAFRSLIFSFVVLNMYHYSASS